jgi:hypothetical protein
MAWLEFEEFDAWGRHAMPEKESLEHLQAELTQHIVGFNSSRRFFRSAYFYFAMSTVALSALTTVLIAAGHMVPDSWWWLSLAALVCSAVTTLFAAYEGLLRSKDLWVQKTDAWMALQILNEHIKYAKVRSEGSLAQSQIDEFQARYEEILMEEHEAWKALRSTPSGATTRPPRQVRPSGLQSSEP